MANTIFDLKESDIFSVILLIVLMWSEWFPPPLNCWYASSVRTILLVPLPFFARMLQLERMESLARYFCLSSFFFVGPILALTEWWAGELSLYVTIIWTQWKESLNVPFSEVITTPKLIGSKKLKIWFHLIWIIGSATSIFRLVWKSFNKMH